MKLEKIATYKGFELYTHPCRDEMYFLNETFKDPVEPLPNQDSLKLIVGEDRYRESINHWTNVGNQINGSFLNGLNVKVPQTDADFLRKGIFAFTNLMLQFRSATNKGLNLVAETPKLEEFLRSGRKIKDLSEEERKSLPLQWGHEMNYNFSSEINIGGNPMMCLSSPTGSCYLTLLGIPEDSLRRILETQISHNISVRREYTLPVGNLNLNFFDTLMNSGKMKEAREYILPAIKKELTWRELKDTLHNPDSLDRITSYAGNRPLLELDRSKALIAVYDLIASKLQEGDN